MTLRKRLLPAFFTAGLIAVGISGCNVFDFAADANKTPLEQAEESLRANDPDAAIRALTDSSGAVIDSTNSMVLYTYAKALLLKSGLSVAEILGVATAGDGASDDGTNAMLNVIDGKSLAEQTAWYQANRNLIAVLGKIRSGEATGDIDSSDVSLDYSVANIVSGMLSLRDTNCDNKIDGDDFQIKLTDVSKLLDNTSSGSGFAFNEIVEINANGDSVGSLSGLQAFLNGFSVGKHAKAARTCAYTYTPDDINRLLATFFGFLATGEDAIVELIDNQVDASLNPDEVRKYIRQAAVYVNKYWYDDGLDNDGDGRFDEEIINGVSEDDDNGDGVINDKDLIDEDSGYMGQYDTTPHASQSDDYARYNAIFNAWKNKTVN